MHCFKETYLYIVSECFMKSVLGKLDGGLKWGAYNVPGPIKKCQGLSTN